MNDFAIVIDTREQRPFTFKNTGILVVNNKLDHGDYSIMGFEKEITIERKSLSDFLGSISHDRDRFKRELSGMCECNYCRKFIIVEQPLKDAMSPVTIKRKKVLGKVFAKNISIGVHPNAVMQSVVSISVLYGIQFYFAQDRADAEHFTLSVLRKYFNYKRSRTL